MEFLRRMMGKLTPATTPATTIATVPPEIASLPQSTEGERAVKQICVETIDEDQRWTTALDTSARWRALKDEPEALQLETLRAAISLEPHLDHLDHTANMVPVLVQRVRHEIVAHLVKRVLPFTGRELTLILKAWHAQPYGLEYGIPAKSLLRAVEKHAAKEALSPELTAILKRLHGRVLVRHVNAPPTRLLTEISDRIGRLLKPGASDADLSNGVFADSFRDWLTALAPDQQTRWRALLAHAGKAGDKAKPAKIWLDEARRLVDAIGVAEVEARFAHWLETTTPDPEVIDLSLDILKGLVWGSVVLPGQDVAGLLGRFCEKCFRKVPNFGARSVKLGNAALWALSERAGEAMAAAELIRLRDKIKYPSARKLIETRLAEVAGKTGQSVESLEDLSLPDFGLGADGQVTMQAGEASADIHLTATEVELTWKSAGGAVLKSVPASVKRDHAAALTTIRNRAKEIEAARASQVSRLEQSWVEDRAWRYADWVQNFRDHPLRRPIVAALIWKVAHEGGFVAVMTGEGGLSDIAGKRIDPLPDAEVRLWHPLDSTPEVVLAWRQRIVEQGLTQPIKQAHREIYVLTDAERRTGVYSNRFAAHILRQHQFRALCQARGWTYGLMGGWDGWNVPERVLARVGLKVQYQVEAIDDGQHSDAYVSLHLSSDQVRFLDTRDQPVALADIPPVIFSEAMRDVDLFVAVTSLANDPGWADGGPQGQHGGYWREWAFGELGQSAQTRKELITALAPRLSIRDKLEVTAKCLVVTGKRQKYAIHFGSGNIMILPDNRYLCIVPDRAPAEAAGLRLPFTGDGMLSTILAKAFLLVDETKITDKTILSQL